MKYKVEQASKQLPSMVPAWFPALASLGDGPDLEVQTRQALFPPISGLWSECFPTTERTLEYSLSLSCYFSRLSPLIPEAPLKWFFTCTCCLENRRPFLSCMEGMGKGHFSRADTFPIGLRSKHSSNWQVMPAVCADSILNITVID